MSEVTTSPEQAKRTELSENDRIFTVLKEIEEKCPSPHLVVGGLGVAGVLGEEIRQHVDLDLATYRENLDEMVVFLSTIGFNPVSDDESRLRLFGNSGQVLVNEEGLKIDVAVLGRVEGGVRNSLGNGSLFIPEAGLNYPVSLRGIHFKTFAPEIHCLIKNRATRRPPWQTINPINRKKDEVDFMALQKISDPQKEIALTRSGFKYTGEHPMITRIKNLIPFKFPKQ